MKRQHTIDSDRYILETLRSGGKAVSGTLLAAELGISRVALWKRIELLRAWGYGITSSHEGYTLVHDNGLAAADLSVPGELQLHAELPSTMDAAHSLAGNGAVSGSLVMALRQTAGRSLGGRDWPSPQGGLYLSLICRSDLPLAHADGLLLEAAKIVLELLRQSSHPDRAERFSFAWPNAILCGPRKIAGLLLEQHGGLGIPDWYVLGLGMDATLFDEAPSGSGDASRPRLRRAVLGCALAKGVDDWLRAGHPGTETTNGGTIRNRWQVLANPDLAMDLHLWNGEQLRLRSFTYTEYGNLQVSDTRILRMAEARPQRSPQ